MIDASHNLKDPMEDLLQSVESIKIAYARALLVDYDGLKAAQSQNDVAAAQSILQEALEPTSGHWSKNPSTGEVEPRCPCSLPFSRHSQSVDIRGLDSKSTDYNEKINLNYLKSIRTLMKKECCLVFDVGKTNQNILYSIQNTRF